MGNRNAKEMEKVVFDNADNLKDMEKSSRDALRKERQNSESNLMEFKNRVA